MATTSYDVRGGQGGGLLLQDRGDALATGGADRDQAATALPVRTGLLVEDLRQVGHDAAAGRGEGVAGGERGAVDVQLGPVDRAQRGVEAESLLAEHRVLPR